MRLALLVSYDGTQFAGWQVQPRARTVQAELEGAASAVFGREIKVTGSGRTDAGVHARGQVCHLDAESTIPPERVRDCLNRLLPPDVRVLQSAAAPAGFDCTRGAKRKTYCYRFYTAETELPLFERYAVHVRGELDLARMRGAARLVEGEHDFAAFRAAGGSAKTTVRTIYSASVEALGGGRYAFTVCGNGFLYNMVRILAGELIAVGQGKEEGITRAFAGGERACLAKTMPAKGLTLESVEYDVPPFCGRQGGTHGIF